MNLRAFRNGSALIACTLMLALISVLAIGLAGMSRANLEVADNLHGANQAFASAESGLEVMRYWLSRVRMPSSTPPSDYLECAIALVQQDLNANEIANLVVHADGSIPAVLIDEATGQNFRGQWSSDPDDPAILRVTVAGKRGLMSRTITADFHVKPYRFPIFNYGIATQGSLTLDGITNFRAATLSWEADAYIGSRNSWIAVDAAQKASFAGDILVGNPDASLSAGGGLDVQGEVSKLGPNDEKPEFPVPEIHDNFYDYATGPVYGPDTDFSKISTTTNAVIAAGTNPTFSYSGNVSIDGILYIEAPNIVTFTGHVNLQGMIVAEGDVNNPGTNAINFGDPTQPKVPSSFNSSSYPSGSEFDALRPLQGSCILAPGFAVNFWKNFQSANGVIAASGLHFDKNISAKVGGTLIDYSDGPLSVGQNTNMTFDRADMVEIPAGFDLYRVLQYNPSSYTLAY